MNQPFQEPFPTEEPDMESMQEMHRLAEPVFREWASRQIKHRHSWGYPLLMGIALATLAAAVVLWILD